MGQEKITPLKSETPKRGQCIVIDANVVISGLLFNGKPGQIIEPWKVHRILPIASKAIIDEYIRVLAYPKFELTHTEIQYLLVSQILPYFDVVESKSNRPIVSDDPSDDKYLHCAKAGKASYIISGDHHLLDLDSYNGIPIVTPAQFLKLI